MVAPPEAPLLSLRALREQACLILTEAGIENPQQESDWLLIAALPVKRHALTLDGDQHVPPSELERALEMVNRRARREPLQYVLGTQEFRSLEIAVTPDVLIPRPETELLVEEALQSLLDVRNPVVADVGTGSGCVAISIAKECPRSTVAATDISRPALGVARANAISAGVCSRVRFFQADLLGAFARGAFHAIVCNPPYIPSEEIDRLQPEVSRYEPRQALNGGEDGLAYYRRLLADTPSRLRHGGHLILELGYLQAQIVKNMAASTEDWSSVLCRKDAAGIERILVARRA